MGKKWQVFFLTHPELLICNMCFSFRHGLGCLGIKGPSLSILQTGSNLSWDLFSTTHSYLTLSKSRSWGCKGRDSVIRGHVQSCCVLTASTAVLPAMTKWGFSDPAESLLEKPWSTATIWPRDRNNHLIFLHSFHWNDEYTVYEALSHTISWNCLLPPLNLGRAFYSQFFLLFTFSKEWSDSFFWSFCLLWLRKLAVRESPFAPLNSL